VRIIHVATGAITESDVLLAFASNAIIVGFNVGSDQGTQRLAAQDSVQIRSYSIIYRLIEDIEAALGGMLEPIMTDVIEGTAEVRAVFHLPRNRESAGCYVTNGKMLRAGMARVIRKGEIMFDGPVANLRRFKDDVREVASGYECGLSIDGFHAFEEGDTIEIHRQVKAGA
jgi:translation initiation factor IF-2